MVAGSRASAVGRLAPLAGVIALVAVAVACGGAAETNLFDSPSATSSGSAGQTSSGTSGTSGASGTSGNNTSGTIDCGNTPCDGTSSSSSGVVPDDAGADSGPPIVKKCNANAPNACPSDQYCKTTGCEGFGDCVARPSAQDVEQNPVCGCDGVTYWNANIAAIHGANVATGGLCGSSALACSKGTCPGDAHCNLDQAACQVVGDPKGSCWQLPKSCEGVKSRAVRRCPNSACISFCAAIADDRQFTAGTGCP